MGQIDRLTDADFDFFEFFGARIGSPPRLAFD